MRRLVENGIIALGVAVGYFACAVIGTLVSVPPSGFAIIWPATAFLISLLLILPDKRWWLCVAGVIPTHFYLATLFQPDAPLIVVTTQIVGNLVLAATTVLVVRRTIASPLLFDTFGSALKFILYAGIAVPGIVNALILGVHLSTGWIDDFWLSWRQWMIAGIFPTITIPPLLVLALKGGFAGWPAAFTRARLEVALLAVPLFALTFLVFGGKVDVAHWPALYLAPFPILLWAAVRLGVGGTSFSLLVFAGATIVQALRYDGPFAAQSPVEVVVSLQAFLVTTSIPLMLLAAIMDERRRTSDLLRESEARMQVAASATDTGLWQWDERAQQLWLTQNCQAMFGLATDEASTPHAFLEAVHPDDRPRVASEIDDVLTQGEARSPLEFRLCANGRTRWFVLSTRADLDEVGRPIRVSGVFRDVSDRVEAEREADQLRQRLLCLRDDERRRMAEELHDSTAQHLVAAKLGLFALSAKMPGELKGMMEDVLRSVGEAATEIRTFSYLLHPPQLGSEGLRRVLRQYVPGFERRTGMRTSLRVTPLADQLPPDQQHAILRIVQESLGNVHRHARATRVSVGVRCIWGKVHVVIRDDGEGIGAEEGQQLGERLRLGIGIPTMAARAQQAGGWVDVHGCARGTTVHVAIPLQREIQAEAREAAGAKRRA